MIQKLIGFFVKNKKQQSTATYTGWKNANHFLLIYDGDENVAKKVRAALEQEGKHLDELAYKSSKRPKEASLANTFYTSDFSLTGLPKPVIFTNLKKHYDVVLVWTSHSSKYVTTVAAAIQSNLKISVGEPNDLYHFVVANNTNADLCINEIVKYLKIINT